MSSTDKTTKSSTTTARPKVDMHIHLAGVGCCDSGCWSSTSFQKRYTFQFIRFLQKITSKQMSTTIDQDWAERISNLVQGSEIDYGVVLGFDGVYCDGHMDERRSQMVIPPNWVFKVCQTYPNLLPGPSINPFRADALDLLDFAIENRACLIKWIPTTQAIDPSSPKIKAFYDKMIAADLPLLVHTGGEKTFAEVAPELNDLNLLRYPLELGVRVVFAHLATHTFNPKEPRHGKIRSEMMRRYPNLYFDNSGICNPSRFFHLPELFADEELMARTCYGSDWPVPSNSFYYPRLGLKTIWQLEKIENIIQRDVAIKRRMGMAEECLYRSGEVIANLDYWQSRSAKGLAKDVLAR